MTGCCNSCGRGVFCLDNIEYIVSGVAGVATFLYKYFTKATNEYQVFDGNAATEKFENQGIVITKETSKNYVKAHEMGSQIWSKGLSHISLNKGVDNIYLSLCSTTKKNDTMVTTIANYEPLDKIWFFCSKAKVDREEIVIKHKSFDAQNYTCIEVRDSAVCIVGNTEPIIGVTDKSYIDSLFINSCHSNG